jgi:hypothetical protein
MYIVSDVSRKLFNKKIYEAIRLALDTANMPMRIDLALHLTPRSRIVEVQFVTRSVLNLPFCANKSRRRIWRGIRADQIRLAAGHERNLAI